MQYNGCDASKLSNIVITFAKLNQISHKNRKAFKRSIHQTLSVKQFQYNH